MNMINLNKETILIILKENEKLFNNNKWLLKLFISFIIYLKECKSDNWKDYEISFNTILREILGFDKGWAKNNKKIIEYLFLKIIEIKFNWNDLITNIKETNHGGKWKWDKKLSIISFFDSIKINFYIDGNVLKFQWWFLDTRFTNVLIQSWINSKQLNFIYETISYESIFKYLQLNSYKSKNKEITKRHFERALKENILKYYTFDNKKEIIEFKFKDKKCYKTKEEKNDVDYKLKTLNLLGSKFNIILKKDYVIRKEKELNEIIFKELQRRYEFDYEIKKEFEFKANGRICKVDTALFHKTDKKDIIFIEYKITSDKRAPAQVLWYSWLYERVNTLEKGTIKAIVVQNRFTEYDLGLLEIVESLYFYKFEKEEGLLYLSNNLF